MRSLICILAIMTMFVANESFAQVNSNNDGVKLVRTSKVKLDAKQVQHKSVEKRATRQTAFLSSRLDLTPAQTLQVKNIIRNDYAEMKAASKTKMSSRSLRAKAKNTRIATQSSIKAVLTPAQISKYDALVGNMKNEKAK